MRLFLYLQEHLLFGQDSCVPLAHLKGYVLKLLGFSFKNYTVHSIVVSAFFQPYSIYCRRKVMQVHGVLMYIMGVVLKMDESSNQMRIVKITTKCVCVL